MSLETSRDQDLSLENYITGYYLRQGYVFIDICLFGSRIMQKNTRTIFREFSGKVATFPLNSVKIV